MAAAWSSSSSSSARRREEFGEAATSSPIPYRVGPLQYSPAVLCKCGKKAARWISWSNANPGHRYLKCFRGREGVVISTHLWIGRRGRILSGRCWLTCATVWRLKKEKNESMHAAADKKIEERRREMEAVRRQLGYMTALATDLDGENVVLRGRISRLQMELVKERVMFVFAFVVVLGSVAM